MLEIIRKEFVILKASEVVEKETGCNYMFENQHVQDLELAYRVLKRDEGALALL